MISCPDYQCPRILISPRDGEDDSSRTIIRISATAKASDLKTRGFVFLDIVPGLLYNNKIVEVDMTYFAKQVNGSGVDLERHCATERELRASIKELQDKDDEFSVVLRKAYEQLLQALLISKADVVARIGRKKMAMRKRMLRGEKK